MNNQKCREALTAIVRSAELNQSIVNTFLLIQAKEALSQPKHESVGELPIPCFGVMRKRPDENDGAEFFYYAMHHNDMVPDEGERVVEGYFLAKDDYATFANTQTRKALERAIQMALDGEDRLMGEWHAERIRELMKEYE